MLKLQIVDDPFEQRLACLRERIDAMGQLAQDAVVRAIDIVIQPNEQIAQQAKKLDEAIDLLEVQVDELAVELLAKAPVRREVQEIVAAMKLARELERVGDESTTILRRALNLGKESGPQPEVDVSLLTRTPLQMLKDAIDAFKHRDTEKARAVIPRDAEVDSRNKQLHRELASYMVERPATITRCLNLMVISKSLERIADHATNIAEAVVHLCEGHDIRHSGKGKARPVLPSSALRDEPAQIRVGSLLLDVAGHTALVADKPIELTAIEFKLLLVLARRRGRVQTREQLLQDVWDYERLVDTRTVDTHMVRLRKKLGSAAKYLQTLRGFGYRLADA